MRTRMAALACVLLAVGCETAPMSSSPIQTGTITPAMSDGAGRTMVRTEIFFGLAREGGTPVGELEWQDFIDKAVSVWFPNGFTVIDANGRWRGSNGKTVTERSKVLVIFHDGSDANVRKFDELRRLYTQRFGMQSVIRASSNVWVAF